uniref:Protein RFT1 homolog n=4 Tax=Micrurus TaxID=8634 RepID=A0A2D4PXT2_MICSU
MGIRILHSLHYIYRYFGCSPYRPLKGLLISRFLVVVYLISGMSTKVSEVFLCCDKGWMARLIHVTVGALCLTATLTTIFFTETNLIHFVRTHILSRYSKEQLK